MRDVISKLESRPTGYRFPNINKEELFAEVDITEVKPSLAVGFQEEYRLQFTAGVTFRADRAQYDMALDMARKQVSRILYGDIVSALNELEYLVYNKQTESAMELIKEIKSISGAAS